MHHGKGSSRHDMGGWFRKRSHEQVRRPHISEDNQAYAFRRSRTLTGSLSNTVRAAGEERADLQSDRLKHHLLRRRRRHLSVYLLVTLAMMYVLWTLLGSFIPSVRVGQGVSSPLLPAAVRDSYQAEINTYLTRHPTERFTFTVRIGELTSALQRKFPEVSSISMSQDGWMRASNAVVTVRRPVATWTIGTTKYYIDEHGAAFRNNYLPEPTLVVEDRSGIDPSSTGAVASGRMLHYVGRLVTLVKQRGYTVERIELPPATSREVDLRLAGHNFPIKTHIDRDPAGQAADISAAVKYLDAKNIVPVYADVRVSSRLYFR